MGAVDILFERLALVIPEDLIEEVARIVGYDKIPATKLPSFENKSIVNANFYAAEKAREELMRSEYSEVCTSVFVDKGERAVANKVGGERPALRSTLVDVLKDAVEKNARNKDLLGLKEVKLFEIGTVWKDGKETILVCTADEKGAAEKALGEENADAYEDLPVSETERYQPFSRYPSITRDIALWIPEGTETASVETIIRGSAGELLVRIEPLDRFEKNGKLSLAFRLVFQSFDRTLTDEDANSRMSSVHTAVEKEGWKVR